MALTIYFVEFFWKLEMYAEKGKQSLIALRSCSEVVLSRLSIDLFGNCYSVVTKRLIEQKIFLGNTLPMLCKRNAAEWKQLTVAKWTGNWFSLASLSLWFSFSEVKKNTSYKNSSRINVWCCLWRFMVFWVRRRQSQWRHVWISIITVLKNTNAHPNLRPAHRGIVFGCALLLALAHFLWRAKVSSWICAQIYFCHINWLCGLNWYFCLVYDDACSSLAWLNNKTA